MKDIRDKAEAMAAYARQAKDTEMIQWATEIKVRAERKAGELLATAAESGERAPQGRVSPSGPKPTTLTDLGITSNQSSRWQSLAGMSDEHFETAVATAKETAGQVTTAHMLLEAAKAKPKGKPRKGPKAEAIREELKAAMGRVSMLRGIPSSPGSPLLKLARQAHRHRLHLDTVAMVPLSWYPLMAWRSHMRQIFILAVACALSMGVQAKGGGHSSGGSHSVRGHTTKNGTYVQPHHATNRDNTKSNNYSHKGNVNPYTGKAGTKD